VCALEVKGGPQISARMLMQHAVGRCTFAQVHSFALNLQRHDGRRGVSSVGGLFRASNPTPFEPHAARACSALPAPTGGANSLSAADGTKKSPTNLHSGGVLRGLLKANSSHASIAATLFQIRKLSSVLTEIKLVDLKM
jgi:hypothetical protein